MGAKQGFGSSAEHTLRRRTVYSLRGPISPFKQYKMEVVGSFYCTFCFAITLSMLWRARFPCEFILLGRILELFRRKGYIVTHELV